MHNVSVFGWLTILVMFALALGWFLNRRSAPNSSVNFRSDRGRLIGACFGNESKANRLIQYEKNRAPGIDHAEAVRRALERLEDDRRR